MALESLFLAAERLVRPEFTNPIKLFLLFHLSISIISTIILLIIDDMFHSHYLHANIDKNTRQYKKHA
ncbi:MAG: hypothetical protein R3Y04_05280 [Rikenellaceae bacterium]